MYSWSFIIFNTTSKTAVITYINNSLSMIEVAVLLVDEDKGQMDITILIFHSQKILIMKV